jgi:hypothetical protein
VGHLAAGGEELDQLLAGNRGGHLGEEHLCTREGEGVGRERGLRGRGG